MPCEEARIFKKIFPFPAIRLKFSKWRSGVAKVVVTIVTKKFRKVKSIERKVKTTLRKEEASTKVVVTIVTKKFRKALVVL